MHINDRVAVVTGAAGGIGKALVSALIAAGAKVLATDIDGGRLGQLQGEWGDNAAVIAADASAATGIDEILSAARTAFGPVDLYFANAGMGSSPGLEATDADWAAMLNLNTMAHVRAAKALVPEWVERGEGYFIATASAAGLLTQIGSATYSVSKHAAVGFAEWLSVTYGDDGVRVSVLCPMGVNTPMLFGDEDRSAALSPAAQAAVTRAGNVLEPAQVAEEVLAALETERFLILPHPEVLEMYRHKGADYDRWIRGMRRYQASLVD